MKLPRSVVVLLWLMCWPLSELVGRPPEMDEDIPTRTLLILLGVTLIAVLTSVTVCLWLRGR